MSEITVELGEPEVEINYASLAEHLMEYATETITEVANEAIENYVRYEMDVSDMVSDYCNDAINDNIDSLLGEVGPSGLCGLGSSFRDAVRTLLIHHIDMKQVLTENYEIEESGGIDKLVQEAMRKGMVVNISFADKQPAEVVTVTGDQVVGSVGKSATDLLPGPNPYQSDEINTRSENV